MKAVEKNKGLKRIVSVLLCLCIVLSYVSPTIFAGTERTFYKAVDTENETGDSPHIVLNQTSSNAEKNNPASDHKKEDAAKEELSSDIERATASNADPATPSNAKKVYTINDVCEMLAELPEADELEEMDEEELFLIYEAVQEAWDAFYSLTEEEQAELAAESEKLNALMAYFAEKIGTANDFQLNYYGFVISVSNARDRDNSSKDYYISSIEFESAEKVDLGVKITFYFTCTRETTTRREKVEYTITGCSKCCDGTDVFQTHQTNRAGSYVRYDLWISHAKNHFVTTDWQKTENGRHTNFCIYCDQTVTQKCTYSDTTYKCTLCGGGEPAVLNSDDVYEISNPSQLIWYGENGNGKSAKLMNDITIGSAASPYVDWNPVNTWGSFDGQGYTITAYLTHSNVGGEANGNTIGLFQVSDGAVLKNLIFRGSVNCNSTGRTGAVCGSAYGSTFENIISYIDITNEADGPTGGIAGYFGQQGNAVMRNCAVYANVTGKGHTGGLTGRGWNETRYWKFYNCAYHGTVSGQEGYTGALMGYSDTKASSVKNSVISNFYYPTGMSMIGAVEASGYQESNCAAKTDEQFASGEVAYLLNSGNTSNPIWRQTCGEGLPIQNGKIVYALAGPDATLYTNDSDLIQKNADGYYEIYRTNQLMMFSDFVNVGNRSVNAVLMNDLNMNSYAWKPICSTALYYSNTYKNGDYPDAGYQGIFDGNYHTIQNLKVTSVSGVVGTYGLVGSLSGTVKNLAVKGFTYTHNSPSDMRTGVIAGQILGGTVQDCYVVNAVITPGANVVGGITASNYAGTVKNCHVYSSSFQGTRYGWIVGDNRADTAGDRLGTVQNCYTDGASPIASGREGSANDGQTKTAAEFKSGKLACLLNENRSAGIWKQTLNSDEYPNFTGKDVYRHEDGVYINAKTPTVSAGNYLIGTVEEMLGFMELVNDGAPSINGQLQADIDMKEIDMFRIGTETYPYAGTFDGSFYTLTVNLKGTSNVAPFSYAGGAVIKQLLVEGTIKASDKFAAGILAHIPTKTSETTLESCLCRVKITSTVGEGGNGDDGTHGGLVGVADSTLNIRNCGFTGSIIGKTTYSCGGLVGWANSKVMILDSYVAGEFDLKTSHGSDNSRTFCRNDGSVTISNSYYLKALKSGQTGTEKTQEQFESGEVTYLLNKAENGVWKQTIGKDAYPSFEGETVYQMAPCYVNYEPPAKNAEGIYEIHTDQNLMAFSQYVNQGNYAADAKVMKDIDMSDMTEAYEYVPIARTEMSDTITTGYQGTFDGNGKTIRNIKIKTPDMASANGLFGTIVSGGVVKNVIVEGFFFDYDNYDHRAGGIAGQLMQGGQIEDCAVRDSTIKASSRVVGGIAGMNLGTIQNCYTKDLSLASHKNRSGGICGDYKGGTIVNCYTSESTLGSTENADVMGTTDDRSKAGVSAETFASGEITYALNDDRSEPVWFQTIGTDEEPEQEGMQVYYGYASCANDSLLVYTNTEVSQKERPSHIYGKDGFCTACDGYEPCAGSGTKTEPYEIRNAGNLYWFASVVNAGYDDGKTITGQNTAACAVLKEDIVVNQEVLDSDGQLSSNSAGFRTWIPIGNLQKSSTDQTECKYSGSFNGEMHTISGLYEAETEEHIYEGKGLGVFGYIENAVIQKLQIKDSYIDYRGTTVSLTGGIAASSKGSRVKQCNFEGMIFVSEGLIGGVVGRNDKSGQIVSCSYSGLLRGGSQMGGIVAQNAGSVMKCWNEGTVSSDGDRVGGIAAQNEGTVKTCFNLGEVYGMSGVGGIAGAVKGDGTVEDSYHHGTISGNDTTGAIVGSVEEGKTENIRNCYYLSESAADGSGKVQNGIGNAAKGSATEDTEGTTAKDEAAFASGEVTWLLNEEVTDGTQDWYQTLRKDEYPKLEGLTVYYGYAVCGVDEKGYSNVPTSDTPITEHWYDNGFCRRCDAYEPCEGSGTKKDPYKVSNGGNLYWFSKVANEGYEDCFVAKTDVNAKVCGELTADITINENVLTESGELNGDGSNFRSWIPIGWREDDERYRYNGNFNGNDYTISGLYCKNGTSGTGLFGSISPVDGFDSSYIKNIGIEDSYFEAKDGYIGGIIGYMDNYVYAEKCYNAGTIVSAQKYCSALGGVVGYMNGENSIKNCYNIGKIAGDALTVGGVVGRFAAVTNAEISNCYYAGPSLEGENRDMVVGNASSLKDSSKFIKDCYYLADSSKNSYVGAMFKTKEQFASGEVTWLLNGSASSGDWKQTIGEDAYPNFKGKNVYYGPLYCDDTESTYKNIEGFQHRYTSRPVFTWSEDFDACTATFTCSADESHEKLTVDCKLRSEVAADGKSKTITASVVMEGITYEESRTVKNQIISADISWTSMEFVYQNGPWDPNTHDSSIGTWTPAKNDGGVITVTNSGTVDLKISFASKSSAEGVNGAFENGRFTLKDGESDSTSFKLNGRPSGEMKKEKLGAITVTIAKNSSELLLEKTESISREKEVNTDE